MSWKHAANEWADATCHALQGLRNIRDGISTPEEVIALVEADMQHCHETDAQMNARDRALGHSCDIPGCAVCDPCHGL